MEGGIGRVAGVRGELERVYREHRQGLFSLALSVAQSREGAEDAVQEAFARLCREGRARPAGDLTAYVFAAVRNAAIDQTRKRRRDAELTASLFEVEKGSAEAGTPDSEKAEAAAQVRTMVDALPAKQKETLVLRLYGGLTFEQVAQVLDEPLGTVTARYRRTLERMREAMTVTEGAR